MTSDQDREDTRQLTERAAELIEALKELATDTGGQLVSMSKAQRSNRRIILLAVIGIVIDLVLTIAVAVGLGAEVRDHNQLLRLSSQLQSAEETQRVKALCPLYQIILNAEHRPAPGLTLTQQKDRAAAFKVIHESYDALNCVDLTVSGVPAGK